MSAIKLTPIRVILGVFISFSMVFIVFGFDKSKSYGFAKLKFCNLKFMRNCSVVSFSKVIRGETRTFSNFTFTPIYEAGNNVSITGVYINQKGGKYRIEHKLCQFMENPWVNSYLNTHSKFERVSCPISPRPLNFLNLELPPRKFPVPLQPGLYQQESELFVTRSKERLLGIHYELNIVRPKPKPRKTRPKKLSLQ